MSQPLSVLKESYLYCSKPLGGNCDILSIFVRLSSCSSPHALSREETDATGKTDIQAAGDMKAALPFGWLVPKSMTNIYEAYVYIQLGRSMAFVIYLYSVHQQMMVILLLLLL